MQIMKNSVLCILLLLFLQMGFAQSNLLWQGYFSYNEIKDLSESKTAIFAASENALFSKSIATNQIKTTNTVDGLSGQTISSLHHSPTFNKTVVGYENGLITVINEADGSMFNVVDIITKQLPANLKKINHFLEFEGIVYVSCDFGIVQFNLKTLQFGDTYFIGDNGAEIVINQTTIYNGFIYAATNNGIRRADMSNKNLVDFSQWEVVAIGNWANITIFGAELFAINAVGYIHKYNANTNSFVGYLTVAQSALDMRTKENYLIVTTPSTVFVYNVQMGLVRQINASQIRGISPSFSCATIVDDVLSIGTKEDGLFSTTVSAAATFENITPMGPSRNNVFSIESTTSSLWAVYGGYSGTYNPYAYNNSGPNSYGISKFSEAGWLTISYDKVLGAKSLSRITVNPNNENQVFISSFYSGLLKLENDIPIKLFNAQNTGANGLKSVLGQPSDDVRVNGAVFDKSGNLWLNNSLINDGFKVMKSSGEWKSYLLDNVLDRSVNTSMGRMIIDKNGTKWWGTNTDGLIAYNESIDKFKKISFGPDKGNLPSTDVRALAVDTRQQLWIGTTKGLRILSNVGSFQTEDVLTTNPIIILEDNLAQELLFEQFITDIVVDGANNKWIGTADSGIFLVSPNGQEIKYHFTINNSPLPSNAINDIHSNSATGEIFIATAKGLISFKGIATEASDDLKQVYVYPNPVRPEYEGTVKIAGLLNKATIKITDIEGNLVYETTSQGGTIEWDTTAFGKYKVASGVYMIFISAQDAAETKVKKVMIIR
jgi:hypothetical protein